MDTEIVRKENCVERRIDDFSDAINGDQEECTAEWRALRNTIFLMWVEEWLLAARTQNVRFWR